jgi:hypothetical protein
MYSWISAATNAEFQCSIAADVSFAINPNIKCNKLWKDAFSLYLGTKLEIF